MKRAVPKAIRQAAETVAHYQAVTRARKTLDLRMARLAREFIIRLTKAQGRTERYDVLAPSRVYGRPLTLYVRFRNGAASAFLAPTAMSKEGAAERLAAGDEGLFHRSEDWRDIGLYDALSALFAPNMWAQGVDPQAGMAAHLAEKALHPDRAVPQGIHWRGAGMHDVRPSTGQVTPSAGCRRRPGA